MTDLLIKAEGAGNDFLIGAGRWARRLADDDEQVIALCHRKRGVGADGVLAIFVDGDDAVTAVHRNADGSPTAFCANGTRCAARAAVEYLGCAERLTIHTGWTDIDAAVRDDGVTLELPPPTPPRPLVLAGPSGSLSGTLLGVGVPHLVIPTDDLDGIDMVRVAAPLRHHPELGPAGANVHFVERGSGRVLRIRSFERGVPDEVLCCGSGVAAAALLELAEIGGRTLTVVPQSGDAITIEALAEPPVARFRLTGPARLVATVEPIRPSDHQQHR